MADPGIPAAFGAGVLSFVSPCVLPLVPGYLSMMSGLSGAELAEAKGVDQRRILYATLLFVAGFSVVFVALGASATAIGQLLFDHRLGLNRVTGVIVIVMGLFLAGVASPQLLSAEKRFHVSPSKLGPYAAPVMGMAFAFGWTPCIGPVLGGVLTLASNQHSVAKGSALLLIYSAGLGVPFVLAGLGVVRLQGAFGWIKAHYRGINIASGALLVAFGVLLFTNRMTLIASHLVSFFESHGLGWVVR
jgi:cytochrome c-type biogenesis protein